jgi:N-acetylglucosaminyldiphosphoundecaprenol N-acetyl-beta-D-mannosaminyltransferase
VSIAIKPRKRVTIGKTVLDPLSLPETVQEILQLASDPCARCQQVVTVNAQFVTLAANEPRLARLIANASVSTADGVPLLWVASALGQSLRGRVNGTELMVRLCEEAAIYGKSVYFLGGRPGAAEATMERMSARYPGLIVAGIDCPAFGFDEDSALDKEVSDRIDAANPDIVFVALGAPKAEYWIEEHLHVRAKVMIGVGGSFELVGGFTKRAPIFWQRAGCEWLWRLCIEPRRLWKRYLVGNLQFLSVVLRQFFGRKRSDVPTQARTTLKANHAPAELRARNEKSPRGKSLVSKA